MLRSRSPFRIALPLFFVFGLLLAPGIAHAQYKNTAFGFDVGAWLITKPTLLDAQGNVKPIDNRPIRLANGLRIGGQVETKMSEDHWWFTARINLGLLRYNNPKGSDVTSLYDAAAREQLGTLLGTEGQIGIKYVFFTDRVRPYLQGGFSYMHLFSFTSASSNSCDAGTGIYGICNGSNTYGSEFLPHNNTLGFHLEPGIEMIFTRDIAFRLFADFQHWIVFNADDNSSVVIGAGFVFFT